MADWQVVGPQKFLIEGDTVYWDAQGDIAAGELGKIFGSAMGVQTVRGYALVLIVIVGPWTFPPAARKFLAQFHKQNKAVGSTAVVGATPVMRMIIDLVLRAISLVTGSQPTTRFFRTRDEAQIWISEQRVLYQQGLVAT